MIDPFDILALLFLAVVLAYAFWPRRSPLHEQLPDWQWPGKEEDR